MKAKMTKAMTSMARNIKTQIKDYLKNECNVYFELYDSIDNKSGNLIGGRKTASEIMILASEQKNPSNNYIFVYVFKQTRNENDKRKRVVTLLDERIIATEVIFPKPHVEKKREKPVHKKIDCIKPVKGKISIDEVELSVRAFNILNDNEFKYMQDLKDISKEDLLKYKNCGYKTVTELEEICESMGFKIGENVNK